VPKVMLLNQAGILTKMCGLMRGTSVVGLSSQPALMPAIDSGESRALGISAQASAKVVRCGAGFHGHIKRNCARVGGVPSAIGPDKGASAPKPVL
jgi:hypothetical protein